MRLIDGKKLADEILGEIFERGQASGIWEEQLEIGALTYRDIEFANGYDKALDEVYRKINDMPTVEAIPIEWIKQWMVDNWELECNYGIEGMIDDWEEENECRRTDKSN